MGDKIFEPEFKGGHGVNQIRVEYFKKNDKVIFIPRARLKQDLESRLRLRTTIGNLSKFSSEIEFLIENLQNTGEFN